MGGNTFAYDSAQNRIAWTSAVGGNMYSTSLATRKLTGMGDTPLVVTAGNTVYFPNMVDMSWPRWLRLNVRFGSDRASNVTDSEKETSFHFHFNDAEYLEIQSAQEHETFRQPETISDVNIRRIHVKWSYPDTGAGDLTFNGVDHQLVFEAH